MNRLGHDPKRVADYVLWLAHENPITPMQLLKLVFICHGWVLGLHGRPLLNASVEAWRYGSVVPAVYHAYKRFGGRFISEEPDCAPVGFTGTEQNVMQQVWDGYGDYTRLQLSELTHQPGTPWDVTRRTSGLGAMIPDDLIEDHYRRLSHQK